MNKGLVSMDVEEEKKRAENAVNTLESLFLKASAGLEFIGLTLASQMNSAYPKQRSPYIILDRIKKLEAELTEVSNKSQQVVKAEQDLIISAKKALVQNRSLVRRMQVRAGLSVPSDSEDAVYEEVKEELKKWNQNSQLRNAIMSGSHVMATDQLNATLSKATLFGP
ncbi:hypothetical protein R1flu_002628 [Riccia fluitans]|uniref:Protein FAM33A n=1 Tax=Riccia fluitans TaxID=41844 RepID=A0ABD1Y6N3_9MARC